MELHADMRIPVRAPFDFSIYIGSTRISVDLDSFDVVGSLTTQLSARGLSCCVRPNEFEDDDRVETIRDRIMFSEKCLLYLSDNYCEDSLSGLEIAEVLDKINRFGDDHVVMLSPNGRNIPEQLSELASRIKCWTWPTDTSRLTDELMEEILRQPALKPFPQMPTKISGYFDAFVYYYDYLRFILCDYETRLKEAVSDMSTDPKMSNILRSFLVIIPDSCRAPTSLVSQLKHAGFVHCDGDRGGNKARDYKVSLYELPVCGGGSDEHGSIFACDFPACLTTFYETFDSGYAGLTIEDLHRERDAFFNTLNQIIHHPENRQRGQHCLVLRWNDQQSEVTEEVHSDAQGRPRLVEFLIEQIRVLLLEQNFHSVEVQSTETANDETFKLVPSSSQSPLSTYSFTHNPRGLCLIISISKYDHTTPEVPTDPTISDTFSEQDSEQTDSDVKSLMDHFGNELSFDVQQPISGRVTSDQLTDLLYTLKDRDHSSYDAFVCCVMAARGGTGFVLASDGKKVAITDLVEIVNDKNCQSLADKPKLFFVQSSRFAQSTTAHDSVDNDTFSEPDSDQARHSNPDTATDAKIKSRPIPSDEKSTERAPAQLRRDAYSESRVSVEGEETMVPSCPHVFISYANLPRGYHTDYVKAVCRRLRTGVPYDVAMRNVENDVWDVLKNADAIPETSQHDVICHVSAAVDKCLVFTPFVTD